MRGSGAGRPLSEKADAVEARHVDVTDDQVQLARLQDGIALTDNGHGALVEVAKWRRFWFAGYAPLNQPARVATLLHRNLCNAA